MTWLRQQIAPDREIKAAPHVLDPSQTVIAARNYCASRPGWELEKMIAEHKRAIEHEQAVLKGMLEALESKR